MKPTLTERIFLLKKPPVLLYLLCLLFVSVVAYRLDQYLTFPRGLEGRYYANLNWKGEPFLKTLDPELSEALLKDRQWQFPKEGVSIEWSGFIGIERAGRYTFAITSNGGSWLYVDNQLVINNGGVHRSATATAQIYLEAGTHPLRVLYLQAGGSYEISLSWAQEDQPPKRLSSYALSSHPISERDYKFRRGLDRLVMLLKGIWLGTLACFLGPPMLSWISTHGHYVHFNVELVFLVVFLTHFSSNNITSFDSKWSIHTAMSLLKEGNTDLNEYIELIKTVNVYYALENIDGHIYTIYPVGVSLIAVPFVFIIDQISARTLSFNLDQYVKHVIPGGIELFIASFLVALTAVFIYLITRLFLDNRDSWLVTFIFAFCTSSWSTASRALWQHGPSMLMLTITLYLILLAARKPWLIQFASIPLAFSYWIRPTNSLSILLLTAFVFLYYRRYFFYYLLWALPIALSFLYFNLTVYYSIFPFYYLRPMKLGANPDFFEALAGNLISPSRGLFIFSPILLFSIYGMVLKLKHKSSDRLDYFLVGIIFLHWIAISSFNLLGWWAGWSFGPRLFSDVLPYFIYFLIPAVARIPQLKGVRKGILTSIFFCFLVISFLIHYRGATSWDTYAWNAGLDASRVWDWHDVQFLRGILR